MDINQAINNIDKYLSSDSSMPRIVDVPDSESMSDLMLHYNVGANQFIRYNELASHDSFPPLELLLSELSKNKNIVFLTGISTFLKLSGQEELNRVIKKILEFVPQNKLIVFTLDCLRFTKDIDHRIWDQGRLIRVDHVEPLPIKIHLVPKELGGYYEIIADGIDQLSAVVENFPYEDIMITSKYKLRNFPNSLIHLKDHDSTYDTLCQKYSVFSNLQETYGTTDEWGELLNRLKNVSWDQLIISTFGGETNLPQWTNRYPDANHFLQWFYFIALKICGVHNNEYLARVIVDCNNPVEFTKYLFNTLFSYDTKHSGDFWKIYDQRRKLIVGFSNYHSEISNYCNRAYEKKEKMLFYLSDNSQIEKERIFEFIANNRESVNRQTLMNILIHVYPALHSYLKSYPFGNSLLDSYFYDYKYGKVANYIADDFFSIVEYQANEREYNEILKPRSVFVHNMNPSRAIAYFVDAMGVEYLSYIQQKCRDLGLLLNINVGRCELPSLTYLNKEFKDTLNAKGVDVLDVKELDELKHGGVTGFDYTKTKLPFHLIQELDIIDDLLNKVSLNLNSGNFERVFLLSDHGASRLAVICERENQWEMEEKGIHSGRCCKISEIDEQPEFATEENGFWCLANYDRFKGGRKANVEVHGGATLEEVTIPFIEITKADTRIDCQVLESSKTVFVSFKRKASLRVYISSDSKNIKIYLNDKFYNANESDIKYTYIFDIADIRRAGVHSFDIYDGDNIIAKGLTFEIKKEGSSERNLF